MKSLYTEIEINAPAERIWRILTGFDKYPDWNPFIKSFAIAPQPGRSFTVTIRPPEKKEMTFHPVCLALIPEMEFRWLGHLLFRGLFDGEHIFELKKIDQSHTLFVQREIFTGVLVPFIWWLLKDATKRGFNEMNQQLKLRAESSEHT